LKQKKKSRHNKKKSWKNKASRLPKAALAALAAGGLPEAEPRLSQRLLKESEAENKFEKVMKKKVDKKNKTASSLSSEASQSQEVETRLLRIARYTFSRCRWPQ